MEMCLIHPALGISNVMVRTGDEGRGGEVGLGRAVGRGRLEDRSVILDHFSVSQLENPQGERL